MANDFNMWEVGKRVIVRCECGAAHYQTIERMTKTMVILSDGKRFRRRDGELTGVRPPYRGAYIRLLHLT